MFLEHIIETVLPVIISACELMGIFVVAVTAVKSFWLYCSSFFTKKKGNLKFELADGLATSLEFKMAAEILKTVQVRDLQELAVLGSVILLRALLSLLIHFEMRGESREVRAETPKNED